MMKTKMMERVIMKPATKFSIVFSDPTRVKMMRYISITVLNECELDWKWLHLSNLLRICEDEIKKGYVVSHIEIKDIEVEDEDEQKPDKPPLPPEDPEGRTSKNEETTIAFLADNASALK